MSTPRRLVGVSWCMPPGLFPRSIQIGRLLKGLGPLGWQSTVVTPSLASLPPGDVIDPALGEFYGRHFTAATVDLRRAAPTGDSWVRRVSERLRGEASLSDDDLWVTRATRATVRIARRMKADALVTFAQPWKDHLVGLAAAAALPRVPWVAHFSDPWSDSLYGSSQPDSVKAIEREREARVIERASAVVFTNVYAADLVMAKYPAAWRGKAHVVAHAMDPDLMPAVEAAARAEREAVPNPAPLRLAHVGNLFVGRRTAGVVFEALADLNRRSGISGRVAFTLVGEGSGLYEARARVFELALEGIVTFRPRVPYIESLAAMRASDALVLIDAPAATNVFLPSKTVDYLMVRRPILALTPATGPSADLLTECGHAVVDPGDVAAVAGAIAGLLERHEAGLLSAEVSSPAAEARLGVEQAARAFAAVLEAAGVPA